MKELNEKELIKLFDEFLNFVNNSMSIVQKLTGQELEKNSLKSLNDLLSNQINLFIEVKTKGK